jgi:NAD-dependent deacetylase sirtuin 5
LDKPERAPVLEMHGAICEPYCASCGRVSPAYTSEPICPALAGIVDEVDKNGPEVDIPRDQLPTCSLCKKGMLRPGVVWFGETPRYLDEIDAILKKTDLLLVIGTSSTVRESPGTFT